MRLRRSAWLIGVPWEHADIAGNLIGQKLILNEFVSYVSFSPYLKDPAAVAAAGLTVLDPKTLVILSFALCGFANFSSIAILAGGFGAVAPELRALRSRDTDCESSPRHTVESCQRDDRRSVFECRPPTRAMT